MRRYLVHLLLMFDLVNSYRREKRGLCRPSFEEERFIFSILKKSARVSKSKVLSLLPLWALGFSKVFYTLDSFCSPSTKPTETNCL